MTTDEPFQLQRHFHAIASMEPAKRAGYVATLRQESPSIAEAVELFCNYLDAVQNQTLDINALPPSLPTPIRAAFDPQIGRSIGPYEVVGALSYGTLASVYVADRPAPTTARVAIKILNATHDAGPVLDRFRGEQNALSKLQHPGIARLLDSGDHEGRHYFVTEYVPGDDIYTFSQLEELSVRRRLELFCDVCLAVHHAHQQGLLHRDIKPDNVLVETFDDKPFPKIVDWGLARVCDLRLAQSFVFDEHGQRIGTPSYMSPEQSIGDPNTDARSDVYSLGAVLYELLCGRPPLNFRELSSGARAIDIITAIRSTVPMPPSKRLRAPRDSKAPPTDAFHPARITDSEQHQEAEALMRLAEQLGRVGALFRTPQPSDECIADIAKQRGTTPRRLHRALRGDLDLIVMKCLEKAPPRRYESAKDLADDVGRYLRREPVFAHPRTIAYAIWKAIVRKPISAMLLLVVFIAPAALVAYSWRAHRATEEANQILEFLSDQLLETIDLRGEGSQGADQRRLIADAERRLNAGALALAPKAELEVRLKLGDYYRHAGDLQHAERLLAPVEKSARTLWRNNGGKLAEALNVFGALLLAQFRLENARGVLQEAVDMQRGLPGDQRQNLAQSLNTLGCTLMYAAKYDVAEKLLTESLSLSRAQYGEKDPRVATPLISLTNLMSETHAWGKAERHASEACAILEQACKGKDHPGIAALHSTLGRIALSRGEPATAENHFRAANDMWRRLRCERHPDRARALSNLAEALRAQGDVDGAKDVLEKAKKIAESAVDDEHPMLATILNNLAVALKELRDPVTARSWFEKGKTIAKKRLPSNHPVVAQLCENLGKAMARSDPTLAEDNFREALRIRRVVFTDTHPLVAESLKDLAGFLVSKKRFSEAEPLSEEAVTILRQFPTTEPRKVVEVLNLRARTLAALNKNSQAEEVWREAESASHAHLPADPLRAECLRSLAYLHIERGDFEGALPFACEADHIVNKLLSLRDLSAAMARSQHGRCLMELGRFSEAEPLLLDGYERFTALRPRPIGHIIKVLRYIVALFERWDNAEPANGHDRMAASWRGILAKSEASVEPASHSATESVSTPATERKAEPNDSSLDDSP